VPLDCKKPLKYSLVVKEVDGNAPVGPGLPNLITFDEAYRQIKVYSANLKEGQKQYMLEAIISEPKSGQRATFSFSLDVSIDNTPPSFIEKLKDVNLSQQDLMTGDVTFGLPPVFNKVIGFGVQLGKVQNFTSFDPATKVFTFNSTMALNFEPGSYSIIITLTDEYGGLSKSSFKVNLMLELLVVTPTEEVKPSDILVQSNSVFTID
jgi:hypothetical protein